MWMRTDVKTAAGAEFRRTEMIEKDEGPDHARSRRGQRTPHRKTVAEVDRARHDQLRDGVAGECVARFGVLAWEETHAPRSFAPLPQSSVNPSLTIAARREVFCRWL